MLKRILVAVVGVPFLLLLLCWSPNWVTAILQSLLSIIATYELIAAVMSAEKAKKSFVIPALMGVCIIINTFFKSTSLKVFSTVAEFTLAALCFILVLNVLCKFGKNDAINFLEVCTMLIAGIIIPLSFSTLLKLRLMEYGTSFVMIPLVAAFCSDTMALFGGMAFGKHKLAPLVSPNKTREGAVSGVLGAMIGMIIYRIIVIYATGLHLNILWCIVLGFFGAIAGQLGDLSFSVVKREYGIKDYGKLLPGHGGVLDRFDSVLFTSPVIALFLQHITLY